MAPVDPTDPTPRTVGGRYRLTGLLGTGRATTVHTAVDEESGRTVAVKLFRPVPAADEVLLRRFRTETRAAAALDDPHLLRVLDVGEDPVGAEVVPFVVTEVMEGGSLRALLATGARLTLSQALVVGLAATRALDHAHRHGVVHRRVHPGNVLFDAEGNARVADFGVARIADDGLGDAADVDGRRYSSPEQRDGGRVGGRSDVYSLVAVLVDAVAPVGEDLRPDVASADLVLGAEFGAVRSVLERAGRVDADERPDAEEFEIALMAAAESLPRPESVPVVGTGPVAVAEAPNTAGPSAAPADAVPAAPAPGSARRAPRVAAAVGVLAVLAAVAGWWFFVRTPTHTVPDVVGRPGAAAAADLRRSGWTVDDDTLVREEGTAAGEVVAQSPPAGRSLAEGRTVTLTVSLGAPLVPYPTGVTGVTRDESVAAIEAAGLRVGRVVTGFDERVAKGLVASAVPSPRPDARGEVPKGSTVALVVSAGPAPRKVPAGLVGLKFADARARLAKVQLGARAVQAFSDSVPKGAVISAARPAGAELPRGTVLTLAVSKGPSKVPVPDVLGQRAADAAKVVRAAGFVVPPVVGPPTGAVASTSPAPGTLAPVGSKVQFTTR